MLISTGDVPIMVGARLVLLPSERVSGPWVRWSRGKPEFSVEKSFLPRGYPSLRSVDTEVGV